MKEIKYRAWIKPFVNYKGELVQGKMCKVHSIHFGTKRVIITSEGYGNTSIVFEKIILEEFTGLTDKNGIEIYEGDILKDKFYGGYTVDYCADWGAFRAKKIYEYYNGEKFFLIAGSQSFIGNEWREWEVIGNIHDNPELLEVAK